MQVTVFVHDTALSDTPSGIVVGIVQLVRLTVEKEPATPEFVVPTATQFVGLVQDTDLRAWAETAVRTVQLVPF
jgi:hypothetical protein